MESEARDRQPPPGGVDVEYPLDGQIYQDALLEPIGRDSCSLRSPETRRPDEGRPQRAGPALRDQAIELPGVLTGDLAHDVGGQVAKLLLDVLRRFRPDPVWMRVVRPPHQRLHADVVDELGADAVELERGLALAAPVVARLYLQAEVAEAVRPLEIHPVERVCEPADAALAERDADVRVAFEHGGADERGQDVHEVHLKAGDACEERRAPREPGLPIAHGLRQRWEGVEMEREVDLVNGLPQRLPHRMPQRSEERRVGKECRSRWSPYH